MTWQGEQSSHGTDVLAMPAGPFGADVVLSSLPVAAVAVDRSGAVHYANRAAIQLLGEQERGRPSGFGSIVGALDDRRAALDDEPATPGPLTRAFEGHDVTVDDLAVQTVDGRRLVLEVSISPLRDLDGTVVGAVATFLDVGSHLEARRERRLFAGIVDSTEDALLSVDPDGRITSWNRSAEALFGYRCDEVMGKPVAVLFPPEECPEELLERISAGERLYLEARRIRKDGTAVMVELRVSPLRTDEGEIIGATATARDITVRHDTERALAAARRQLQAQNRRLEQSNSELEQFAYVASHDLSEPLRAVAGMVTLLARRYRGRLDQDADEFIEFAVDGCGRMRAMIDDILAYSRAARGDLHLTPVDVAAVMEDVRRALSEPIQETGAELRLSDLPTLRHADRAQLSQILQNLVGNALKFRRPDVVPVIEVRAVREGCGWRIEVGDNGIGVESQFRSRIFRMFQRLHTVDTYPGSGIGLAIADRLVSRHGGRMGVDNSPLGGAMFWFTIPDDPEEVL